MAKPWRDVASSPEFQALSSDDKEAARQQYFAEVVAPQVPTDDLAAAKGQFDDDTGPSVWGKAKNAGNAVLSEGKDAALAVGTGVLGLGQMASNLAYAVTGSKTVKDVADALGGTSADMRTRMSPEMQAAEGKKFVDTNEPTSPADANVVSWLKDSLNPGEAWKDPRAYLFQIYNQTGSALPMMGVGRLIGMGAEALAGVAKLNPAIKAASAASAEAVQAAVDSGASKVAALQIGKEAAQTTFAEEAAKLGVQNASLDKTMARIYAANVTGQTAAGTYLHGSDAANSAMESIATMPHEKLMQAPEYAAAYQGYKADGESEAAAQERAKEDVRRAAGITAAEVTGSAALPFEILMGRVNAKLFSGDSMGGSSRIANVGKAAAIEMPSNAAALGNVAFGGNVGVQQHADPTRPWGEDVANTAVGAAIGAVGMAALHAFVAPVASPTAGETAAPTAAPPGVGPVNSDQVLGAPAAPTAAEKALYTPKNLTALDRVAEIDRQLADTGNAAIDNGVPPPGMTRNEYNQWRLDELNRIAGTDISTQSITPEERKQREAAGVDEPGGDASYIHEIGGKGVITTRADGQRSGAFSHELRHAIAETVFGSKISNFLDSLENGGAVAWSKYNTLIQYLTDGKRSGLLHGGNKTDSHTETAQSILDAYNRDKEGLRKVSPDLVGMLEGAGADKFSHLNQTYDEYSKNAPTKTDASSLRAERDGITATWPKTVPGAPTSFTTESGARLDGQYALVSINDLTTSHNQDLKPTLTYPKELQPRERDRAASEMQVSGIVQRLDPARLGASGDVATGAPIIGADGLVESGNARTIALKRVYQANGQKAEDYKQYLRDNAEQFGITPESVDAVDKPVLVRVRSTPVNRAEFARQANQATAAQMSPVELGRNDSARIDSMEDLNPTEDGDFSTANSGAFIRRFMAKLPATEQAGMIDADGELSQAGHTRIRNAVLSKAYGDSPVLLRMVESMDDNLRNTSKALMQVAPQVAKAREAIGVGALHDADIAPDLLAAVDEQSALRKKGTTVESSLAQQGVFGDKLSPESKALLMMLDENKRSPRKTAEFIKAYYDALEGAGNPNQGSLLADVTPPSKVDLLAAARRIANVEPISTTARSANAQVGDSGHAQESGVLAQNAPSNTPGHSGNEVSEWVAFPQSSGSLGVPRADMPQVKGDARGALVNFLNAKGITNTTEEVPANTLRPTQAEFSTKKAEKWGEIRAGVDRSVLASSDGYILDGHHQWVAALATDEPVKVIRFDAPMSELLPEVRLFPSAKSSEGSTTKGDVKADPRAAARQDFQDAMADLAQIVSKNTRMMMLPEDTPGLMPTLVKLFGAAIREGVSDIKELLRHVREALKNNQATAKLWNKISNETYRKAAALAMAEHETNSGFELKGEKDAVSKPSTTGMDVRGESRNGEALGSGNTQGKEATGAQGQQSGNRGQDGVQAAVERVATIDGRTYNYNKMTGDNYIPPHVKDFMPADEVKRADDLVEKYHKDKPEPVIPDADWESGKALILPELKRAEAVKAEYDQKIIDITKRTGALGQLLAPLKSVKRAVEKMYEDARQESREMRASDVKDLLRSTIVVEHYADVQKILDEIGKEFELTREPKNRTDVSFTQAKAKGRDETGGYADVLVNVRMSNGTVAEIQINVPEMIAAKEGPDETGQGHLLFEAAREQPKGSKLYNEILAEMRGFYDAAFLANQSRALAAQAKNLDSVIGAQPLAGKEDLGINSSPLSPNLKAEPSGNATNSSPLNEAQNSQPGGNLAGTFISSTSNKSIANSNGKVYTGSEKEANRSGEDEHTKPGTGGTQGEGTQTAARTDAEREAAGVSDEASRGNRRSDSNADNADSQQAGVQQGKEPAGSGRSVEGGGKVGGRDRASRNAGLPAGRDIPAKSGRNFRFGNDDLNYQGSWQLKAKQNVEAVELLGKLEKEGRQATHEEQGILARFIGWGSSEIANTIFGKKLDAQIEALNQYDVAMKHMEEYEQGFLRQRDRGFYAAFSVLKEKNPKLEYYATQQITKAELQKAKPEASVKKWGELRDRLKEAMTPEQWDAASRSTQNAHYTSKQVVGSMWKAISKMGFKGGTIIEPGAGIGVFPGLMSSEMATNSVYTGIEMDPITGGILKQLFPDERILVESFVDSKLPENYYDVAVGNPPFAAFKVLGDPKYAKMALVLHDYFFAKSIDSVKPGGLLMFVTSRYTMDKKGDQARAYMADRADLVGAIRLPQTAFMKNAGTEVVTDVLFLRKKIPGEAQFSEARAWSGLADVQTDKGKTVQVNEYFAGHPEMVLGTHSQQGSMYSKNEYTVLPLEGNINEHFAKAVESLPADIFVEGRGSAAEAAKVRELDFNPKTKKEGSFYVSDAGTLMQVEGGQGIRADDKTQKNAEVIKAYIPLRDAVKQSQYDQLNDGDWQASLKVMQKAYDKFTKDHGQIFQHTEYLQKVKVDEIGEDGEPTGNKVEDEKLNRRFPLIAKLRDDPEWTLVAALENFNEDTGAITPSKWLSDRTLGKPVAAEIKTPTDALLATLDDTGEINMAAVAARIGLSEQETIDSLGTLVYEDPTQGWVMSDDYLSGNVKKKLANAEEAAKTDKRYERNVDALRHVQPAAKGPAEITPQIGMNWIPAEYYQDFLEDKTGVRAKIEYIDRSKEWHLETIGGERTTQAREDWGVGDKAHAGWLMEKALSGSPISMYKSVSDGKGGSKQVFDPDRTAAAQEKLKLLRKAFRDWIFQDAGRTESLVKLYNDKFNTTIQRSFDGKHLSLPGTSKLFKIYDHVKRGAWRIIQTGNTYLAHAVGSGKTFEMVISAMEQKRLGKIKKPMIIVPGHMLQQFASEWQQLYPTARLMVADEKDFHTDNRRKFVSRAAMSDLDGIIMTHSSFGLLDLDPAYKQKMLNQELDFMRAAYEEAGGDLDDIGDKKVRKEPKVKRLESQIEKLEQQLAEAMSSEGKDKNVRFDEMGVDFLYVDEAHLFRKLSFATNRQVKGINPAGSQMAWDLYMKSRWLAEKNPARSLAMASGTPITNTTAELYNVQRYLKPQALEDAGLSRFDDWAAMFGEESTKIEATASGKYEPVTRFSNFVNVGEMTQMFRDFADVLNEDHLAVLLGDKRPQVQGGARKSVITPKTEAYKRFQDEVLVPRINKSKAWKPTFAEQYNPDPIIAINIDARLAAIDMRFMDPAQPNDSDSKLNRMIDGVIRVYKDTADQVYYEKQSDEDEKAGKPKILEPIKGSTQMVFFESGFGKMVAQRRGFNARAWMDKRLREAGIPPAHVAYMEDYKKSSEKLKLFKDVNAGKVRILVGSSAAMGTGVNAQQRLIALHHLDAPYVPATLEQREGRIVRQGNKNPEVQLYAYSMKGSFDEQMWGTLARKKAFIDLALSGDPNIRRIEDISEVGQYEQAAALIAENPYVLQLAGVRSEIEQLQRLARAHEDSLGRMRNEYQWAQGTISSNEKLLPAAEKAAGLVHDLSGDKFTADADGKTYTVRKEWGEALLNKYKALSDKLTEGKVVIGKMSGFDVVFTGTLTKPNQKELIASANTYTSEVRLMTPEPMSLATSALVDPVGMALRAVNQLVSISREPGVIRQKINDATAKKAAFEGRLDAPFPLSEQLANKYKEEADLERQMMAYTEPEAKKTGLEREQELEDAWQAKTGAITPLFSRGLLTGPEVGEKGSVTKAVGDQVLGSVLDSFKGSRLVNADRISMVDSFKALPANVREEAIAQGGTAATTYGLIDTDNHIWIVRDNHSSASQIEETIFHELRGHLGTRALLGNDLVDGVNRIFSAMGDWGGLKALAEKHGMGAIIEDYRQALVDPKNEKTKDMALDVKIYVLTDELMARIAQKQPGTLAKIQAWVGKFKAWLREHFPSLTKDMAFNTADIHHFLALSTQALQKGTVGSGAAYTNLLTTKRLSDDAAAQEKYLNTEAKMRGYKSIDDMAEKNYPLFEKVAALWRQKNPADVMLSRAEKLPNNSDLIDYGPIEKGPWSSYTTGDKVRTKEVGTVGTLLVSKDRWTAYLVPDGDKNNPNPDAGKLTPYAQRTFSVTENEIEPVSQLPKQISLFSRSAPTKTAEERAQAIIDAPVKGAIRPADAAIKAAFELARVPVATQYLYNKAASILDVITPEKVKAGVMSDYGMPEAVIDRRAMMVGRQRQQLRATGNLIDKLSTLTRGESRVAYEWMNSDDPQSAEYFRQQLPADSVKVLADVEKMIDSLSKEAVALGQINQDVVDRHRFAYLRRSYVKHTTELTKGEAAARQRAISILGDQYKGRGMTDAAPMSKIQNVAPEWWKRKTQAGKADAMLKGEKFIRLERRAPSGEETIDYVEGPAPGMTRLYHGSATHGRYDGKAWFSTSKEYAKNYRNDAQLQYVDYPTDKLNAIADPDNYGQTIDKGFTINVELDSSETGLRKPVIAAKSPKKSRLLEVAYWPASEPVPGRYGSWDQSGTWEVRGTKGDKLILWRDFTKQERVTMGEIDEVRYAIAKTLQGMIHDVETGKYLEWLAHNYAKKPGEKVDGQVIEASEKLRDAFGKNEWVKVPDSKISGTEVLKYGTLAGRYLPGPIWNDVRQLGGSMRIGPKFYQAIMSAWKTSKTALSPAVHLNNVMANFVMADWHDVTAAHTLKALRIMMAASPGNAKGLIGRASNVASKVGGIADKDAAQEIMNRYQDSGGGIGTWAVQELHKEQIAPLLEEIEKELGIAGANQVNAQIGVFSALQYLLHGQFRSSFEALKRSTPAKLTVQEANNMLSLYQSEDDVFRLATWLKAKEEGLSDQQAGKLARKSFLDYSINAPWIQALRQTALPFIAFTYRAAPMALETLSKKPWKLAKLAAFGAALNALGYLMSGGDEDDERKLLPEEKAGRVWGLVPKLMRMPWNDASGSPVFLDVRRFVPIGDIFDLGQGHSAIPMLPALVPGGPLGILAELALNKEQFTGKDIVKKDTDTAAEITTKVIDYLWKAAMPNVAVIPGTYAWSSIVNAATGKTDSFGREQSTPQAIASSFGVKLGSYPRDVMMLNESRKMQGQLKEIEKNITDLTRERQKNGIDQETFMTKVMAQADKKRKVMEDFQGKMAGK